MHLPSHIYDPIRVTIAITILEKEYRKLFLGLPASAWPAIDSSIRGWAEEPTKFHLESEALRDFWDSFAAVIESIKLKSNFISMLTAENITWTKTTLPIRSIQITSPLEQLQKVSGLNLRNDLPFAELLDILAQNPAATLEQKQLVDQHSTDPQQDTYPIIALKTEGQLYKAMDGNRRTLRAALYGKKTIEAWAGEMQGDKRKNYWVPLNDMFQLVKIFKDALSRNDEPTKLAVALVLKTHFEASVIAEYNYQNRIANQNEAAEQLYHLTQSLFEL